MNRSEALVEEAPHVAGESRRSSLVATPASNDGYRPDRRTPSARRLRGPGVGAELGAPGSLTFDSNGRIVASGDGVADILGVPTETLAGANVRDHLDAHIVETMTIAGNARRLLPSERARDGYRLTNVRLSGDASTNRRVDLSVRHHADERGALTTAVLHAARNATAHVDGIEQLSRFSTLARLAPVGIVQLSSDWRCIYVNDMWNELSRLSADESAGLGWIDAIHPDDVGDLTERMQRELGQKRVLRQEVRLQSPLGPIIWVTLNMTAVLDVDGRITGSLLVVSDVTENYRLLERLHDLAHKDALTGLWNRAAWIEALDRRLASAERPGRLGVLYIDLDGFKAVNDTVGHDHGDALLQAVSERLLGAVRAEDMLARLGGDEFAVVMPELPDEATAASVARRIVRAVGRPFTILGRELSVGASVGIALADTPDIDRATLVKRADTALYAAKHAGRSRHVFYTVEQDLAQRERSELTVAVRQAVDAMDFTLHYQPQVAFADERIVGFEALLRTKDDTALATLNTETLVEILEGTGLIGAVGHWVLDTACEQLASWRRTHDLGETVTVSVNVSGRQLGLPGFVDDVARVLERHALPSACLVIEITESVLVDTRDSDVVDRLKGLGVSIALDDFGKGYSSLAYLGALPLDHLKIDRSFVDSIATSDEARKIVRCIVSLARSLGLQVTAEGIEHAGALAFLLEEGCHDWQGYLYSRPVGVARIEELLTAR